MDRDTINTIKRRLLIGLAVLGMVLVAAERACVPDAHPRSGTRGPARPALAFGPRRAYDSTGRERAPKG